MDGKQHFLGPPQGRSASGAVHPPNYPRWLCPLIRQVWSAYVALLNRAREVCVPAREPFRAGATLRLTVHLPNPRDISTPSYSVETRFVTCVHPRVTPRYKHVALHSERDNINQLKMQGRRSGKVRMSSHLKTYICCSSKTSSLAHMTRRTTCAQGDSTEELEAANTLRSLKRQVCMVPRYNK